MRVDDYYIARERLERLRAEGISDYEDLLLRFIHYIWRFREADETLDIDQFNISLLDRIIKIGSHTTVAFDATLSSQNIKEVIKPADSECYLSIFILNAIEPDQTFSQIINMFNATITMECAQYIALYARLEHTESPEINYSTHNFVADLVASKFFPTSGYKRYIEIISASNMDTKFIKTTKDIKGFLEFKITRTQYGQDEVMLMNTIATLKLPFVANSSSYRVRVYTKRDGTFIAFTSDCEAINATLERIVKNPRSTVEPWRYAYSESINGLRLAERNGQVPGDSVADRGIPTNLLDVMAFMKRVAVPTELVLMLNTHTGQTTRMDKKTVYQILYHYYFMLNMEKSLPTLPRDREHSHKLTWVTQGRGSSPSPDWRPLKSPQQLLRKIQEYLGVALSVLGLRHYHEDRVVLGAQPLGLEVGHPYTVALFLIQKCPEILLKWLPETLRSIIEKHSLKTINGLSTDQVSQTNRNNAESFMILIGITAWLSQLNFHIDVCHSLLVKYLTTFAAIDHLAVSLKIFGSNVFDYAVATTAICRAYNANGRQWSEAQTAALAPGFIRLIFCMQPQTKSDWLLSINLNKAIPEESTRILHNALQFLHTGRSGDKRPVLKAGRWCKESLEELFNTVRSATGATHTARVTRADK